MCFFSHKPIYVICLNLRLVVLLVDRSYEHRTDCMLGLRYYMKRTRKYYRHTFSARARRIDARHIWGESGRPGTLHSPAVPGGDVWRGVGGSFTPGAGTVGALSGAHAT